MSDGDDSDVDGLAAAGGEAISGLMLLYELMVRVRAFEKRVESLYRRGETDGPVHLSTGQEAIAAGFGAAMGANDLTLASYRGHGHAICRGVPMRRIMAELLGREDGLMGGKGGSMHLTSVEHGLLGCNAIVGSQLPIAVGAALSSQYRGSGQVVVCFFGDGATNIGAFHESLNLAAVWGLPIVFVCENNLYMEYSPIGSVTAVVSPAADRAAAYGLDSIIIDGNDVVEVHRNATSLIEAARAGRGPALVEALTYRHGGHAAFDTATYRPKEEVASWLARDPIPALEARLATLGVEASDYAVLAALVDREVDEATAFARESEPPRVEMVTSHVWADGGTGWHN